MNALAWDIFHEAGEVFVEALGSYPEKILGFFRRCWAVKVRCNSTTQMPHDVNEASWFLKQCLTVPYREE